jgi:predicted AlkP superfamily pyrophosphatase or phosphodiesterase
VHYGFFLPSSGLPLMNRINKASVAISLLLFLSIPSSFTALAQRSSNVSVGQGDSRRSQRQATSRGPKLVVLIVVDQFRYDYLERFEPFFGKDGFRRLLKEGAFFTNANYDYAQTYTAPGHACISAGSIPALNGIIGNAWVDPVTGQISQMASDSKTKVVTNNGVTEEAGSSPRLLIGTAFADQIRLANNFKSKVVAVSYKDRSAIFPGGKKPNGAYWFGARTGEFITSDYYTNQLPGWVKTFNTSNRPDKFFGAKWERSLPEEEYSVAQTGYVPVQKSVLGQGFPYTVTGGDEKPGSRFYNAFQFTPFASDYLVSFAKAAVEGEGLGKDEYVDMLSISFSSPDLIGHSYGPDSQEIMDAYIRLDQTIADLLGYLNKQVGLSNVVIAVTADHGVCPVPEYMDSLGYEAARISGRAIEDAVKKALNDRFNDDKLVSAFVNDQFFFNRKRIADKNISSSEVARVAGEAALTVPGVIEYFTRNQIMEGRMPTSALARRITNGFHRERSGDIWIITKPFSFVTEGALPTTHGSPYHYDTHVPIIFFGARVKAGRVHVECSPSDIAPTLAAIIRVEPPATATGRALAEAIADDKQISLDR